MSFTDGKARIATAEDCKRDWGCAKNGANFRCYLCGHKFIPGDTWRFQYTGGDGFTDEKGKKWGVTNFMTCDKCDGPDVISRWVERVKEFYSSKFWAVR